MRSSLPPLLVLPLLSACALPPPAELVADGPYAVVAAADGSCTAASAPMLGPWDVAASGPLVGALVFVRQADSTAELSALAWRLAIEPGGTVVHEGEGLPPLTWELAEDGTSVAVAIVEFVPAGAMAPLLVAGAPLAIVGAKLPFYFELAAAADDGTTAGSLAMAPELCNGCLDVVPATAGVQVCAAGAPVGCSAALAGAFTCGGTP